MEMRILQLKKDKTRQYGFMSHEFASENGFDLNDYDSVWEENIDSDTNLDDIWTRFQHENEDCPENYHGRSMSVSDIIDLEGHLFYCEPTGWKEL